jgi:cysteine desulfurase
MAKNGEITDTTPLWWEIQNIPTEVVRELRRRSNTNNIGMNIPTPFINTTFNFEQNYKAKTVANTRNLHFPGVDGETLLILLDQNGVLTSMGSACASGALEPSRVLLALGISKTKAKQSLRISFSRLNTIDEIKIAAKKISELNSQIKSLF